MTSPDLTNQYFATSLGILFAEYRINKRAKPILRRYDKYLGAKVQKGKPNWSYEFICKDSYHRYLLTHLCYYYQVGYKRVPESNNLIVFYSSLQRKMKYFSTLVAELKKAKKGFNYYLNKFLKKLGLNVSRTSHLRNITNVTGRYEKINEEIRNQILRQIDNVRPDFTISSTQ
ncbi:hypothetical protein RF11_15808 [Thelohanellus kitauei]|uniref:Uncharacterized protein n=1 Tax=Thelohanellus kitauei TaxID=669202 RepID=A0A0C2JA24_THEKT|nr:hypothetical protein RF11_15808 [Thelohanellus kitauei]